jgi:hypothetical protein
MPDDDPQSCPPDPTRRKFLLTTGSSVAAKLGYGLPALANSAAGENDSAATVSRPTIESSIPITLRINGKDHQLRIQGRLY